MARVEANRNSTLYDIATHFGTVAATAEVTAAIAAAGELMNRVLEPHDQERVPRARPDAVTAAADEGLLLEVHNAHLIRRAHQRATVMFQQMMGGSGLTPTQLAVLGTLDRFPGLPQKELGRRTAIDTATLSSLLRRLDRAGLVERLPSEQDQRVQLVRLTEAGRAATRPIVPGVDAAVGRPPRPDPAGGACTLRRTPDADRDRSRRAPRPRGPMTEFPIRKIVTTVEEIRHEFGPPPAAPPPRGRDGAGRQPLAGRYEPDLQPAMEALKPLGTRRWRSG